MGKQFKPISNLEQDLEKNKGALFLFKGNGSLVLTGILQGSGIPLSTAYRFGYDFPSEGKGNFFYDIDTKGFYNSQTFEPHLITQYSVLMGADKVMSLMNPAQDSL